MGILLLGGNQGEGLELSDEVEWGLMWILAFGAPVLLYVGVHIDVCPSVVCIGT